MGETEPIIYLETELRPNASLGPVAFLILLGVVGLLSFAAGIFYYSLGAWPVLGFFGLDVFAIWLAFKFSFRAQAQVTYVRVDETHLRLWHVQRGRPDRRADLPTAFVRVTLEEPVTHASFLTLEYSGKAWVIGRFLMPERRKALAVDLRRAIWASRRGHHA